MDVKIYEPFVSTLYKILPQFGLQNIKKNKTSLKTSVISTLHITILIGLIGNIKGNVAYSMSNETAEKIASIMMMGMLVDDFENNEMAQSAISEITNMIVGNAAGELSNMGYNIDITTPSIFIGNNKMKISQVQTLCIEVITDVGLIEVNIGLEH